MPPSPRFARPSVSILSLLVAAGLAAALAACGDPAAAGDGGIDSVEGTACGGRDGIKCQPDEYCDFPRNTCGATDETGRCMPRPKDACPPPLVPERTCGCDGVVYASACDATFAGTDLDGSGACRLDPGAFACGYRQCRLGNQYCVRSTSDVVSLPDDYTCGALPAACPSPPTCACLAGQPCGSRCAGTGATGLTLTCPGG
jgi:hypothetical protein